MAAPEKARVLYEEPMSRHTSWRVGGPADLYFKPRSREELVEFLRALFKIGYLAEGKQEGPWVGFEVKPQNETETSEQIIAGTKRVWAEAWSRL